MKAMLYRIIPPCLFLLLLLVAPTIFSDENPSTNGAYKDGVAAYNTGQYQAALEYFLTAEQQGKQSSALYYNLGVCYYKLGDYLSAKPYFEGLAKKSSNRDMATYNLGLIAAKLGKKAEAQRWFQQVTRYTRNKQLKLLAQKQVRTLTKKQRTRFTKKRSKSRRFIANVNLKGGLRDNIPDPRSDTNIENKNNDFFGELSTFARVRLNRNYKNAFDVKFFGYGTIYNKREDYDRIIGQVGISQRLSGGKNLSYTMGLDYQTSTLGDDDYLDITRLSLSARNRFSDRAVTRIRYRFDDISPALDEDIFLQGQRHRLDFRAVNRWIGVNWIFKYQLERDQREDLESNNLFFSYSANRGRAAIGIDTKIFSRILFGLESSFQYSQYLDDNRFIEDNLLIQERRTDELYQQKASLGFMITPTWVLELQGRYTKRSSNIDFYDYDQWLATFGINIRI